MLTRFDPTLTDSQDKQHLAFNSLPANIVLQAQEVLKVKMQLKSQVQIIGRELARIDDQVQLPDLELRKVEEQFAAQVGARLEGIQGRHAKHEAVTSQLHKAVHGTDEQSIHQDFMLDREIVRVNEQHKRELEIHEISINLMKQELQQNQEAQKKRDGEISEPKTRVETLMGQVKGKGQASDPTPEASGAGGGNPPPPPRRIAAGAPGGGGDPDDEGEESGRKPDQKWRERPNERPAPHPQDDYDAENHEQLNLCSRVRANALGQCTRVLAEPPAQFKNEKHQDIHRLLLTCTWSSLQAGQGPEKRGPLALFPTPPHSTAWGGQSLSAFPAPVRAQVPDPPIPQPGPH